MNLAIWLCACRQQLRATRRGQASLLASLAGAHASDHMHCTTPQMYTHRPTTHARRPSPPTAPPPLPPLQSPPTTITTNPRMRV